MHLEGQPVPAAVTECAAPARSPCVMATQLVTHGIRPEVADVRAARSMVTTGRLELICWNGSVRRRVRDP